MVAPMGASLSQVGPKLSIIVLAYNGEAFLEACLSSLLAQSGSIAEIIVVDNASTDHSVDVVQHCCPAARLIRSRTNLGFSGGCNLGLRAAAGEFLVLLNQDTRVGPGWVETLLGGLQAHADAGIMGCKILYPESRKIQHAGGWVEWPLGYAHHFGYGEEDHGQWDQPRSVEFVTGAALALRRTTLEKIGYLDEQFWPGYFEDLDYCHRAAAAGLATWYWPAAVVWHRESPSTEPAGRSRHYQRGRLRFVLKDLPPARFLSEFVPAEQAAQAAAIAGDESQALRLAYLAMIPDLPRVWRESWQSDAATIKAGITALQQLRAHAWQLDWQRLTSQEAGGVSVGQWTANASGVIDNDLEALLLSGPPDLLPEYVERVRARRTGLAPSETAWLDVKEYQFRSPIPVVGKWIARLRGWWYGLAARWALLYFMQQQEAINRRQESYRRAVGQRLLDLAEENALLAARLAEFRQYSEDGDAQR
jgi:GT2 family glycosyltransferase